MAEAHHDLDVQKVVELYDQKKAEEEAKARLLRPFNTENLPYDRERVIQEGQFYLFQHVAAGYEFGKRLIILKKYESRQALATIIEEKFRMPLRTARLYEQHARICANWPRFRAVFDKPGMASKGMALLAGLSDPELQAELAKFEDGGELLGLAEVELQAKTWRELRAENRRLRREKEKAVSAATEKTERENARLRKKIKALEAGSGQGDLKKSRELLEAGDKLLGDGLTALAQADFLMLRQDAGAVQVGRLLIDKMRRIADWLEKELFPGA